MFQIKYEFPLPNDEKGEGYKFTEKELCDLLDKTYQKGYDDGYVSSPEYLEAHTTTYSTTNQDSENIICSRCGKEIKSSHVKYLVNAPTLEENDNTSYWCEDCYDSFIEEMEKPMPAFKDIKPATDYTKLKQNAKDYFEARRKEIEEAKGTYKNKEDFREQNCLLCGSQRCGGPDDEPYSEGCLYLQNATFEDEVKN